MFFYQRNNISFDWYDGGEVKKKSRGYLALHYEIGKQTSLWRICKGGIPTQSVFIFYHIIGIKVAPFVGTKD